MLTVEASVLDRDGKPLVESISADPATLEKVKTMIEIIPGGTATPVKRFMMGAPQARISRIFEIVEQ